MTGSRLRRSSVGRNVSVPGDLNASALVMDLGAGPVRFPGSDPSDLRSSMVGALKDGQSTSDRGAQSSQITS
jgi:hypothetical protein